MSESMHSDGYTKIYNIDIVDSIVDLMKKRALNKTGLKCKIYYLYNYLLSLFR